MNLLLFNPFESAALLLFFIAFFGFGSYLISWLYTRSDYAPSQKLYFLLANRNLNYGAASFSIAATWVWAPALFVSAQQAYFNGWIGLFWFTVPNILCLILFAFFADRIRDKFPDGFTLSDYMKSSYGNSNRVQNVYLSTLTGLIVCAFAVQLLAGGKLLTTITGIPFWTSTLLITLLPLSYSLVFGLKSSIITDFVKILLLLTIGACFLVPTSIVELGGLDSILAGLGGNEGKMLDFFSTNSWNLFLTFGLPITIGLISGPFGDQSFWQRAFSIKRNVVKRSFITGAFIFSIVPIMMGLLSLAAAGNSSFIPVLTGDGKQLINLQIIGNSVGITGIIAFFTMTMAALTSILDSKMTAISSLVGHDLVQKHKNLQFLSSSRWSIIILSIFAIGIANIPDIKILHLFLLYGTLRSATLLPTICTLLDFKFPEPAIFYGILAGVLTGLPIFAYGNINNIPWLSVIGSLTTVLLPFFTGVISSYVNSRS
jgi:Na+/proline symporter